MDKILEKQAQLSKYLPYLLGGAAALGTGIGAYHYLKPKTPWEQIKEMGSSLGSAFSGLGSSVGDMASDVTAFAQNNPEFLNSIARKALNPQQAIPTMTPPTGIPGQIPMGPGPSDIVSPQIPKAENPSVDTSGLDRLNFKELQDIQDQVAGFSPYNIGY